MAKSPTTKRMAGNQFIGIWNSVDPEDGSWESLVEKYHGILSALDSDRFTDLEKDRTAVDCWMRARHNALKYKPGVLMLPHRRHRPRGYPRLPDTEAAEHTKYSHWLRLSDLQIRDIIKDKVKRFPYEERKKAFDDEYRYVKRVKAMVEKPGEN